MLKNFLLESWSFVYIIRFSLLVTNYILGDVLSCVDVKDFVFLFSGDDENYEFIFWKSFKNSTKRKFYWLLWEKKVEKDFLVMLCLNNLGILI